jgi:3-deoxy-manno-octulosonate cytidylyltransferase (CMP-KDO synthetase)
MSFNSSIYDIGTVITKFNDIEDIKNPNSVKVSISNSNKALYFSRSVIPNNFVNGTTDYFRHIGLYAYNKSTLDRLINLAPTSLELSEKLEQLRFIENGFTIDTLIHEGQIPSGIDTAEDLKLAIDFVNNDN